ncbi:MAG: hypothetical protein LR011_12775 [Verrucomicrobia bacterium]|nr:hypothetical protein [Verrucomicrobiota bacterium]
MIDEFGFVAISATIEAELIVQAEKESVVGNHGTFVISFGTLLIGDFLAAILDDPTSFQDALPGEYSRPMQPGLPHFNDILIGL